MLSGFGQSSSALQKRQIGCAQSAGKSISQARYDWQGHQKCLRCIQSKLVLSKLVKNPLHRAKHSFTPNYRSCDGYGDSWWNFTDYGYLIPDFGRTSFTNTMVGKFNRILAKHDNEVRIIVHEEHIAVQNLSLRTSYSH